MKLKNKVIIITGASRGLGRAMAELFVKEGGKVVVNYLNSEKEAQTLVSKLGGENAIAVQADVSRELEAKHLVDIALKIFGRIDVLVNNAGAILQPGDSDCDLAIWRRTLEINLNSAWLMTKLTKPHLLNYKGNILNISSYVAQLSSRFVLPYSVAKAGIDNLTRATAIELAPNVRVNAIAPGNIDTDMTKAAGTEFIKKVMSVTPLKRLGIPEEIAKAALFLVSEDASFITGEILNVDGGYRLK